jgi:hypothetical protein
MRNEMPRLEVEATVVLAEQEDGWHIRVQFDGGEWFYQSRHFPQGARRRLHSTDGVLKSAPK